MLKTHGRYTHVPITSRPSYRWPNGSGLAVYVALNVEAYNFAEGLAEDLVPGGTQPDVLNATWREYGTRVGAWRILEALQSLRLPATILLNSEVCRECPDLVGACHEAGHEIAAHGRTNSEAQASLDEPSERALIDTVSRSIGAAVGEAPAGWLGPWLSETALTPDLLQEAGYRYLLDWGADDQPIWLSVRGGKILSLPYSQEVNDSVAIIGRFASPSDFADMAIDQIDEMQLQAQAQPLVLGLAIHANIIGQPFRLRHFRRVLTHLASLSEQIWVTRATDIAEFIWARPDQAV